MWVLLPPLVVVIMPDASRCLFPLPPSLPFVGVVLFFHFKLHANYKQRVTAVDLTISSFPSEHAHHPPSSPPPVLFLTATPKRTKQPLADCELRKWSVGERVSERRCREWASERRRAADSTPLCHTLLALQWAGARGSGRERETNRCVVLPSPAPAAPPTLWGGRGLVHEGLSPAASRLLCSQRGAPTCRLLSCSSPSTSATCTFLCTSSPWLRVASSPAALGWRWCRRCPSWWRTTLMWWSGRGRRTLWRAWWPIPDRSGASDPW